jgi:hypothetical protein
MTREGFAGKGGESTERRHQVPYRTSGPMARETAIWAWSGSQRGPGMCFHRGEQFWLLESFIGQGGRAPRSSILSSTGTASTPLAARAATRRFLRESMLACAGRHGNRAFPPAAFSSVKPRARPASTEDRNSSVIALQGAWKHYCSYRALQQLPAPL